MNDARPAGSQKPTPPPTPTILEDPVRNRGVAFSADERDELGLVGRLPSGVLTLDEQAKWAYVQLQSQPAGVARNFYLEQLHDRNETLYFRVLSDHLAELLPILDGRAAAGKAIAQHCHEHRRPRAIYLSVDRPGDIEKSFATLGLGPGDVDVIACSDAGHVPGIGDWGVGGIHVAAGKLDAYSAVAGIHPGRVIPVSLDAGTDNEALLNDPLYVGNRHARRRGQDYDAFIRRYVLAAARLFPGALLHFQDFGPEQGLRIPDAYGGDHRVFTDAQGTGVVVMAAVYATIRATGIPMKHQELVVHGVGPTGAGLARLLHGALVADGATDEQARSQIWLVGSHGLVFDDMDDLHDAQRPYARKRSDVPWASGPGPVGLGDTIDRVAPTILCRAAAGLPAGSVEYNGITFTIGQADSALVFPGLGLGVVVSGAARVTPRMLRAAATAVAGQVEESQPGAPLLPGAQRLRACSARVAEAVVRAAVTDRVAAVNPTNLTQAVRDAMWLPAYPDSGRT